MKTIKRLGSVLLLLCGAMIIAAAQNGAVTTQYIAGALNAVTWGGVSISGTPAVGNVPTAISATAAVWQAPSGSGTGASSSTGLTDAVLIPGASTFANLPSATTYANRYWIATDCSTATGCTTGGGTNSNLLLASGGAWTFYRSISGSASGATASTGLTDASLLPGSSTFASLPSATTYDGRYWIATDCASQVACTAGGGTFINLLLASGGAWTFQRNIVGNQLLNSNNLSDLNNVAAAKTNLALGSAAGYGIVTSGSGICLASGACTFAGSLNSSTGYIAASTYIKGGTYLTNSNCSNTANPAVCGSANAGSMLVAAGATTEVVNTTAVTANSQILLTFDSSLGTKLSGTTCNTTVPTYSVSSRAAGTSFTLSVASAPLTNPDCFSYLILN